MKRLSAARHVLEVCTPSPNANPRKKVPTSPVEF